MSFPGLASERPIRAVLFDIDDTLVDLRSAMEIAVRQVSTAFVPELSEEAWEQVHWEFRVDPTGLYQAFLNGELSFVEQRIARARRAFAAVGGALPEEHVATWNNAYELEAKRRWAAYPDVAAALDFLEARRIPYGAVSNNVVDYQRNKLDLSGLQRISVLVGTDTVGVPKPDPAIFHEGARQLGFEPRETLYVGDNLLIDAIGASEAGLPAVWLNREGVADDRWSGAQISGLDRLAGLLEDVPSL
ncbi:HAD family hydrolase [Arthrobacter russicus]|uniref:Hydrolase of the HAD superfamily n=1 Tax=Arthrobacter russicus TaxID=172040 RepID=A0ABU1J9Z8_9MICC|nr:HAD family hydrolase [Arthrobacter russicus]MDR6268281.1 putative hydrolase of the HAD superfamily [Arthrobacter russicus]